MLDLDETLGADVAKKKSFRSGMVLQKDFLLAITVSGALSKSGS
jgi:hypothetical protein